MGCYISQNEKGTKHKGNTIRDAIENNKEIELQPVYYDIIKSTL